jgi:hypothetical protein
MEFVIGLIVLAICAAVGLMAALLSSSLGARRGPIGQRRVVAVATGIGAVLLGSLAAHSVGPLFGLLAAGIYAVAGYVAFKRLVKGPVSGIDYVEDICELVREHGLANFDALDGDGDGIIIRSDLKPGKLSGVDPEVAREIITHMHKHIDRIGHWISSRANAHGVSDSEDAPGARRVVLTCHSNVYGISRADLESYPRRARKRPTKDAGAGGKPASAA